MLLSEIEYSYNVRVHLLPSAAPPVLGGALFHYPGAPIACGCRRITSPVWNGAGAVPAAQFVRFRLILNELVSRRAYAPLRQELTRYGRDGRKCGSSKEERGMQQTLGVQPMSQPVDGR
jgi:hypothetical protein